MDITELEDFKVKRIKVRALVICGDEYIFIRRTKQGRQRPYLVFPGGRLKKSDRSVEDKKNIGKTLKEGLVRELQEELAAREIVVGELLGISKRRGRDLEALFLVRVAAIDWDSRTGKEFTDPAKGTYKLVRIKELTKEVLGKDGYRLKPKEWCKLICTGSVG